MGNTSSLTTARRFNSNTTWTRRKMRAMQASFSIESGAALSMYTRSHNMIAFNSADKTSILLDMKVPSILVKHAT